MSHEDTNYLGMSDEAMLAAGPPVDTAPEVVETSGSEDTEVDQTAVDETPAGEIQDGAEPTDTPVTEDTSDEDDAEDAVEDGDHPEPKEGTENTSEVKEAKDDKEAIDYKQEYNRLLAPFKANGKEIAVNSVDDAVALMQMGANYNKKMAGLKPSLKILKMLENHQLLSEEKISYLIDLDKKSPGAINKLVKDSGIDPMDLDAEKAGEYTPNSYTVEDREMELDTVLDSIQETPSYNRTLDILGTKWDGASKQVIAASPQLVKVINDHVQSGIYDAITKEVERERVFGRLNGLSDIDAYRQVGDAMQARGGFNQLLQQGNQTSSAPAVVVPKPKTADDSKLRDKKRAASSSAPSAPVQGGGNSEYNPLGMSDEAFTKLINDKFL